MTETKLNSEHQAQSQNQNQNQNQNSNHQHRPNQNIYPALGENEAMLVLQQNMAETQHATPVIIKKPSFLEPMYKIVGFNSKTTTDTEKECTTREVGTLIMLGVLVLVFIISVTGFTIMWFTELYNNIFVSQLILSNNSQATEYWMHPPLNPHLRVHIFNYTNIDRFINGIDKKLKVKDLGPYTYSENSTKVQVTFNSNYTVTYKDKRSYTFVPDLSCGRQFDQVTVPNIPYLTAVASGKYKGNIENIGLSIALSSTSAKSFTTLAADSLLWGYDDPLMKLKQRFFPKKGEDPNSKFGLLRNRNGTSPDTYQIFTGEDDIRKLAVISEFNGKREMDFWSTKDCNQIDGSDGSQFPPHLMDKKKPLEVYIQSLCRKLPLVFDSEVNLFDGVPAWRYKTPMNVFSHPDVNPENQCFCHIETGVCAPSGVFNGTLCYEAPIFVSFPHFFTGTPDLYKNLEGIYPNATKHQTFADVHPRLAFPIGGASRIQINVQIIKGIKVGELKKFEEGMILPVLWIEVTSGEITDHLRGMIYHSSFTLNAIQLALKYGTLFVCVISFALLVAAFYFRGKLGLFNDKKNELTAIREKGFVYPNNPY